MRAETRSPVRLTSSTLILDDESNLFLLMIWIRTWYSLGVVILNRCPRGFRSPEHDRGLWRCHLVTLLCSSILPSETTHNQTTEQWVQEFQVGYWLAWLPLCFEIAIHTQRQRTAECIRYKCETIYAPQERTDGAGQKRRWTVKFCKGAGGVFWKLQEGTLMKLT